MGGQPAEAAPVASTASTATAVVPLVSPPPPAETPAPVDLQGTFDLLAEQLPEGAVGVTVAGGGQVLSFGTWTAGAAWSTIKVPLSIAALRVDAAAAESSMLQAITQSDNAAAEQLWQLLGGGETAAAAVQGVLFEAGDTSTVVQSEQVRPPYSPFGQTTWSQDQAARFASALPCVASAGPVLDQMHNIQSGYWGLATMNGAATKGGWGPEADGGYLVRQIAVVTNDAGNFGVSLAAKPSDFSFETGTAMLDVLAGWIGEHLQEFPAGSC